MPRVALLVETARGYGRDVLRGVVRYARLHGPWGFYITPGDFAQVLPRMKGWGGTGIIARIENRQVARAILDSGLPTIALDLSDAQLRPGNPLSALPELASNSEQAAAMAADHLLSKGFQHYAYVGVAGRVWSRRRLESFVKQIRQGGFEPAVYPASRIATNQAWESEQAALTRWLERLPKPLAVMACNDDRGREVLEACRALGLTVPDQVAVIGMDNDELLCELSDPPLSSVALASEAGGFRAAALLDQLMRGARAKKGQRLLVEPTRVVPRRSTDVQATADPLVAPALRYIHDHAGEAIGVVQIAQFVEASRRALEMRFRRELGRSIHDELRQARLDRARQLLLETDLPLPRIAAASGFASTSYLTQVFRRYAGSTPAAYRRKMRGQV